MCATSHDDLVIAAALAGWWVEQDRVCPLF